MDPNLAPPNGFDEKYWRVRRRAESSRRAVLVRRAPCA